MWQRQIQRRAAVAGVRFIPAGCGSWTMITSQSPSRLCAFITL